MTFDERQLREVEANEAWLAEFASPRPDKALVARVKAAARHAADEQWLAEAPTPGPSSDELAGIKAAVRAELAAGSERAGARWLGAVVYRLAGVFAAAAMIALAVGVMHFAPAGRQPTAVAVAQPEELFIEALEAVLDEAEPQLLAIEEALSAMESSGAGLGNPLMDSGPDTDLNEIDEQIDALGAKLFETS